MARITLKQNHELEPHTLAAVQAIEASGADSSTMRGLAHSQAMFDSYFRFYMPARAGTSIPEELIELVRLKIARHNDCFT
jgi:alkylhydroperoxidase family enzyme